MSRRMVGCALAAAAAMALVATAGAPSALATPAAATKASATIADYAPDDTAIPDDGSVLGQATQVPKDKTKDKDIAIHWGDDGDLSPNYSSLWYLEDGPMYASFKFAVLLKGTSGFRSAKAAPTICVESTLTKRDANDGAYSIRLYNEYTPYARSSGYSGWVSFPSVLNGTYQYCFPTSELPDFDRYDVFTAQFKKTNTTHYYYGHIRVFQK